VLRSADDVAVALLPPSDRMIIYVQDQAGEIMAAVHTLANLILVLKHIVMHGLVWHHEQSSICMRDIRGGYDVTTSRDGAAFLSRVGCGVYLSQVIYMCVQGKTPASRCRHGRGAEASGCVMCSLSPLRQRPCCESKGFTVTQRMCWSTCIALHDFAVT